QMGREPLLSRRCLIRTSRKPIMAESGRIRDPRAAYPGLLLAHPRQPSWQRKRNVAHSTRDFRRRKLARPFRWYKLNLNSTQQQRVGVSLELILQILIVDIRH